PLILVEEGGAKAAGLSKTQQQWATGVGFAGQRSKLAPLPDDKGGLAGYLFGMGSKAGRPVLLTGMASSFLEGGRYRLEGAVDNPTYAALGFKLGAYRFDRYRTQKPAPELVDPSGADRAEVARLTDAAFL